MQAEGAIAALGLEGPSQDCGALAHADDPVPAAGRRSVHSGRVRHCDLNRVRLNHTATSARPRPWRAAFVNASCKIR